MKTKPIIKPYSATSASHESEDLGPPMPSSIARGFSSLLVAAVQPQVGDGSVDPDVKFTIKGNPQPQLATAITADFYQQGTQEYVEYLTQDKKDSIKIDATVKISTVPKSTGTEADAICKKWELVIVQGIMSNQDRVLWKNSIRTTTVNTPCQDANAEHEAFTGAEKSVTLHFADTPSDRGFFEGPNGDDQNNLLEEGIRKTEFMVWLFAYNRETKEKRYLLWWKWKIDWHVTFDVGGATPKFTIKKKELKITGKGKGMGSREPVTEPKIKITEEVKPR